MSDHADPIREPSARPWWFDGRDVFHKKPGTNLDQIIIPLGHLLSDTYTADGAVNPADIRLFVEAVNERDALAARCAAAEKERDEALALMRIKEFQGTELAAAEQFVEDVREWVAVAATRRDHPLRELLAEYDAGRKA